MSFIAAPPDAIAIGAILRLEYSSHGGGVQPA
jgi:hypothetical protein